MKATILGIFALAAVAHSSIIPLQTTATLVRTPKFDSAVIQSERLNGAFSYSTVENHAYSPLIQTYATYPWVQGGVYYPNTVYTPQYYPTYTFVQQPQFFPAGGASYPGQNQPGVVTEVSDPADNTENQAFSQVSSDDDSVAVESA